MHKTRSSRAAGNQNSRMSSTTTDRNANDTIADNQTPDDSHGDTTESVTDGTRTPNYEVEQVVDKKVYNGEIYYKLRWVGWEEPTWELAKNCSCNLLIKEYEKRVRERSKDEDEDEWEVEDILESRVSQNETQYLVRWKNWDGEPEWVSEKDCTCVNLIAAFENPKLRKMWNFQGSNTALWLDREAMLKYMRKYARINGYKVNILKFDPDFPDNEKPIEPNEGLNMGPLCYKNHWYLVIILINYICITKKILVCDPLNTLIGVPNARVHPVYKRLTKVYRSYTVTPAITTPMERSDMCAFYVLASYERALFCLNKSASFIVNKLFFDHSRPELIRAQTLPHSDHEISVNLLCNETYLDGPKCEFCGRLADTGDLIDQHIRDDHFTQGASSGSKSLKPSPGTKSVDSLGKRRSATNPDGPKATKRISTANKHEKNSSY